MRKFNYQDTAVVVLALRVAAEQYRKDAETATEPRIAQQFMQQAADAQRLFEVLEDEDGDAIFPVA